MILINSLNENEGEDTSDSCLLGALYNYKHIQVSPKQIDEVYVFYKLFCFIHDFDTKSPLSCYRFVHETPHNVMSITKMSSRLSFLRRLSNKYVKNNAISLNIHLHYSHLTYFAVKIIYLSLYHRLFI